MHTVLNQKPSCLFDRWLGFFIGGKGEMQKLVIISLMGFLLFVIATPACSELIDRGGGLIYDTELNITWLQDANYAFTSGGPSV